MTRKQQRLSLLGLGMAALAGATGLVLVAFNDNLVFFYSPSELRAKAVAPDRRVRIGGLVENQSVTRGPDGQVSFRVTDGASDLGVVYEGILPDLFREGQGVVAEGKLRPDGVFAATTVLAKHDERYMPREVVDALKQSGHWQEGGATTNVVVPPAQAGVQGPARAAAPGFPPRTAGPDGPFRGSRE